MYLVCLTFSHAFFEEKNTRVARPVYLRPLSGMGEKKKQETPPPEKEPQDVDASDESSTITMDNSDAGEDKHDTHSDVLPKVEYLKCFHHRRWTTTLPFQVPDNGYCEDDVPLTFVDSTAELLEKSQPRRFPAFVGASSPPKASKSKYARLEGMYQRWKKVMVRGKSTGDVGKEEVAIFRATDEEVHAAVEEVAEGTLSLEGYLAEVKRIRNRQQLGTGH